MTKHEKSVLLALAGIAGVCAVGVVMIDSSIRREGKRINATIDRLPQSLVSVLTGR
jgi:hypothetical protein